MPGEWNAEFGIDEEAGRGASWRRFRIDPLDADCSDDEEVRTTWRALMRVAMVAAEAALRAERDGLDIDAIDWMARPLPLFGGFCALEACLDRAHCVAALLSCGLSLGDGGDVETLDALVLDIVPQDVVPQDAAAAAVTVRRFGDLGSTLADVRGGVGVLRVGHAADGFVEARVCGVGRGDRRAPPPAAFDAARSVPDPVE